MPIVNRRHWAEKATVLNVLAVVALSVLSAHAQCKDSDFPEPGKLVAAPTRPVETSSPDPVQVGVVQIETGFGHTWGANSTSQDSVTSLVKLGLWCNAEIRWSAATMTSVESGGTRSTGAGDMFIASQYRLVRESVRWPSIAMAYTVKAPTANANEGLGSGRSDHVLSLMLGKNKHGFSAIFNASYFSVGQADGSRDGKSEWTLAVSHPLGGKFGFTGEVFGDSELNAGNVAYATSTWVLSYSQSPRLVFDVGSSATFTPGPGAPGNGVFVGLTYAIGDIYRLSGKVRQRSALE